MNKKNKCNCKHNIDHPCNLRSCWCTEHWKEPHPIEVIEHSAYDEATKESSSKVEEWGWADDLFQDLILEDSWNKMTVEEKFATVIRATKKLCEKEFSSLLKKELERAEKRGWERGVAEESHDCYLHQEASEAAYLRGKKEVITTVEEEMMNGELRNLLDEHFPKDKEAEMGIRPSKSNRSSAIVLWGELVAFIRKLNTPNEKTNL